MALDSEAYFAERLMKCGLAEFTDKFYLGGANPKGNVNSGLNTAMDRSGVHHSHDQGWGGNQGLKHHNIGSLSSARALQRGR